MTQSTNCIVKTVKVQAVKLTLHKQISDVNDGVLALNFNQILIN